MVKLRKLGFDDLLTKLDPSGQALERFVVNARSGKKALQTNWTNIDFVSMANEVGLGEHVRHAYRIPLEFAHPSVHGILQWLEFRDDEFHINDEPNEYSVEMALPIAHLLALEVLRLQIEHFELDGDDPVFQRCLSDYEASWKKEER